MNIIMAMTALLVAARPNADGTLNPEVAVQPGDYSRARSTFHTRLLRAGPSPQALAIPALPAGVSETRFRSGALQLRAWIGFPAQRRPRMPVVIFLHGGFAFGIEDWDMTAPFRDAGYIVVMPILRGENGQAGAYSLFYDEVDDVLAAAAFTRRLPYVDRRHVFLAGHSAGGTLALLAAEASGGFRAAASFSASPDQVLFLRYGIRPERVPFDATDAREVEMRSPLAYAASLRNPTRLYFGAREAPWRLASR